jgi:hypothetical protein
MRRAFHRFRASSPDSMNNSSAMVRLISKSRRVRESGHWHLEATTKGERALEQRSLIIRRVEGSGFGKVRWRFVISSQEHEAPGDLHYHQALQGETQMQEETSLAAHRPSQTSGPRSLPSLTLLVFTLQAGKSSTAFAQNISSGQRGYSIGSFSPKTVLGGEMLRLK